MTTTMNDPCLKCFYFAHHNVVTELITLLCNRSHDYIRIVQYSSEYDLKMYEKMPENAWTMNIFFLLISTVAMPHTK